MVIHFKYSDKTADCLDGSDEGEHCKVRECDLAMFRCTDSGRCIPKVVVTHKKIILFYKNFIYIVILFFKRLGCAMEIVIARMVKTVINHLLFAISSIDCN